MLCIVFCQQDELLLCIGYDSNNNTDNNATTAHVK